MSDSLRIADVIARLRAGGPVIASLRRQRASQRMAREQGLFDEQIDRSLARLSALGYSEAAFHRDRGLLKDEYIARAVWMGDRVLERLESIVTSIESMYLVEDDEALVGLERAVRNWLPFVSLVPFVALLEDGSLPDAPPDLRPMVSLPALAGLRDSGPPMPTADEARAIARARFVQWRGVEDLSEADPRQRILDEVADQDDDALRTRLYTEHPVLLCLRPTTSPFALEAILRLPRVMRRAALRQLVLNAVAELSGTVAAFRQELVPGQEADWGRLEPLLLWAEAEMLAAESPESYLRELLAELRAEVKPFTLNDAVVVVTLVIGIVLTAASLGLGGVVGIALGVVDLGVGAVGTAASVYLTIDENERRARLNAFEHVDAALRIAGDEQSVTLNVLLGLLALTGSGILLAGAVRSARRLAGARPVAASTLKEETPRPSVGPVSAAVTRWRSDRGIPGRTMVEPPSPVEVPSNVAELVIEPTAHAPGAASSDIGGVVIESTAHPGAVAPGPSKQPTWLDSGRARPGRAVRAGGLDDLELTVEPPAGRVGGRAVTRDEQMHGVWSSDDWERRIRGKTPTTALERWAVQQLPVGSPDSALIGRLVTEPASADHIVSVDRIRRLPGFAQLDIDAQLEVLNLPQNFVPLSRPANQSKGALSYARWIEVQTSRGIPIDPKFAAEMIAKEEALVPVIQSRISDLLRDQLAKSAAGP